MSKLAQRITELPLADDLEEAIDDAIHTCGGDLRVAIGALILGQRQLLEQLGGSVSSGYVRRRMSS